MMNHIFYSFLFYHHLLYIFSPRSITCFSPPLSFCSSCPPPSSGQAQRAATTSSEQHCLRVTGQRPVLRDPRLPSPFLIFLRLPSFIILFLFYFIFILFLESQDQTSKETFVFISATNMTEMESKKRA